ncbi:PDZ domain-containing protein sprite isoform X2 [Rhynchophorus ferrugineus]|uniref:PDZ domain-containing protein sprite isoform X2 n=1 Tax=Rhynchophorus ferrugineus TaxID=354439 RepID=UPI003FCD3C9F
MTSTAPLRSPTRSRSQTSSRHPRPSVHSDCPPEADTDPPSESGPGLGQRSASLNTLQPTVIQPRMAQLETLEAKMASIEVSLSSTPRRKKISPISLNSSIRSIPKELATKELENLRNALRDKENIIQSLKGQLTVPGLRLNAILNGNNNNNNNNGTNNRELTEVEKKQAEDRLVRLKTDIDNKRLAIKNLKMALERLDITDNIDVRIQQAELEYQLGREELNLLTLLEETRALQLCIEESNRNSVEANTLYSCVEGGEYVIIQAIKLEYDPKSPKFAFGPKEKIPGLWIDWALEETGLQKDDRLIEVNGKIVLTKTRDDLVRLLAADPDPAQLVILRKLSDTGNVAPSTAVVPTQEVATLRSELENVKERADEAQRIKDGLKSDNIRLTHRISYLEEQVSELLNRKSESDIRITSPTSSISKSNQNVTNINITTQHSPVSTHSSTHSSDIQVFQKGPQMTTLVSNGDVKDGLMLRSKSSLSNVSSTHISAVSPQPDYHCHKNHRHKSPRKTSTSRESLDQVEKISYRKHHHHREKDYNSETNSNGDRRYSRRTQENNRYSVDFSRTTSEKEYGNDVMDQSYKKATKIVHELTRGCKDLSLYEKHRQKCITASEKYDADILKHYNARKSTSVLDFRSEVHIGPKYYDSRSVEDLDAPESPSKGLNRLFKKIQNTRSVKSLDFDSDCNSTSTRNGYKSTDYASEADSTRKPPHYQNLYENSKPRPTPPKKPLRLSLHKTHSLQSVDSSNTVPNEQQLKNESRKRNHKGQTQVYIHEKNLNDNGDINGFKEQVKWNNYKRGIENGTWC